MFTTIHDCGVRLSNVDFSTLTPEGNKKRPKSLRKKLGMVYGSVMVPKACDLMALT